jgi:hypothetical protein
VRLRLDLLPLGLLKINLLIVILVFLVVVSEILVVIVRVEEQFDGVLEDLRADSGANLMRN